MFKKCNVSVNKRPIFVREAEVTLGKQLKTATGMILATSNDWLLQADVRRPPTFQLTVTTNLRPNIVLS